MQALPPQPGGREPAPGPLELVQAFVNTNDIEGRRDRAGRPKPMRGWLVEHGLLEREATLHEADFVRLLDVREAFRGLASANSGRAPTREVVDALNREAARSLAVDFAADGGVRAVGAGADRAVGRLLAIVLEAIRDGSWKRMKACRRDVCRWVFYDHSRNLASSWCSMAICGNRTKTRAYRRRRTQGRTSDR